MSYPKLEVGDVVQIKAGEYGLRSEDIGKFVEIVQVFPSEDPESDSSYTYTIRTYFDTLVTQIDRKGCIDYVWGETFGETPFLLCDTVEYGQSCDAEASNKPEYSVNHYDNYYYLTPDDIEVGKIRVDAYWVAKQWCTGSRDDSGALWHSLKTIARFGEKNSKEREIKALYNQAKALARIYGVDLSE